MKIVFMGTPEFSKPILEALIENYDVELIVTQPDRYLGNKVIEPVIKKVGIEHNIKVFQPQKIRKEYEEITKLNPDMIITCAYGQIIPKELLESPKYGAINIHASLLPKLRGGAPIHHAIIDGYDKTGITIMYMNDKMDEGDIILQKETQITDEDTTETLHDRLSLIGRDLILEAIPKIVKGVKRIKQNEEEATYGYNISREDEKINFEKTKRQIFNQIRGLNSYPGAYTTYNNKILKVWKSKIGLNQTEGQNGKIINLYEDGIGVKCADGEIILTEVQLEGKKRQTAKEFINGHKNELIGSILK
jgi:methionyl-tRNA formyltransferase